MKKIFLVIIVKTGKNEQAEIVENGIEDINEEKNNEKITDEFIQCLAEAGVIIYGSKTCPACDSLVQEYGDYEKIKPIYLDCSGITSEEEAKRCLEEIKTGYIPEVQIKGNLFEDWGSPEALAEITGCKL